MLFFKGVDLRDAERDGRPEVDLGIVEGSVQVLTATGGNELEKLSDSARKKNPSKLDEMGYLLELN